MPSPNRHGNVVDSASNVPPGNRAIDVFRSTVRRTYSVVPPVACWPEPRLRRPPDGPSDGRPASSRPPLPGLRRIRGRPKEPPASAETDGGSDRKPAGHAQQEDPEHKA